MEFKGDIHTAREYRNGYSQRLVREWGKTQLPSSMAIPYIHQQLMKGVTSYSEKGIIPLPPGRYRDTDVTISTPEAPDNLYARGFDVAELMGNYCRGLDRLLERLPRSANSHVASVVQSAAWAYYVFERIHPFLDGDGRVGRIIMKRILSTAKFRDIIFHDPRWMGASRSTHLEAMERVGKTGNLAHLELFLLRSLSYLYDPEIKSEMSIYEEIQRVISEKQKEIAGQTERFPLTSIWEGFRGKDMNGNEEPKWMSPEGLAPS